MAGQIEQPGPVSLLEEASHLLRRASFETLLCHWIGSVPFALMLLVFWTRWTHPPVSDLACAGQALALALLLIWMNCWRSVYAGRLYANLNGAAERPWNRERIWRLVANHSFLAATKLLILPVSLVAVFPFATTIAFYRNVAVLAGRDELGPLELVRAARHTAGRDKLQCWLLQFVLLLLSLVTMLNLAVTFILLPQLIKTLSGYESAFTRSGAHFFENRLFLLLVLGATWLLFDPFVQAAYCVRCFQAESVETGEDLRAALRRIRSTVAKGTWAAVVLVAAALPVVCKGADAVSPTELRQAVRQTMEAPEYNWRIPPPAESVSETPWIVRATDRAVAALESAVKWVGKMIDRLLRWIFGRLGLSPVPVGGEAPARALHWSVWALLGLAAAMAGWVVWRSGLLRRRKPGRTGPPPVVAVRLDEQGLSADRLPEAGWLELADRCLAEGNIRLALRALYLANLAWLGRQEFLTIHPGKTDLEFEVELRRRARQSPEARELFSANVRDFERTWYGLHEVLLDDAHAFRQRGDRIKTLLRPEAAA